MAMMILNSPQNLILQERKHQEKDTNTFDFRAPPPSPIGSSRRTSSVANDEVLAEFLEHSLRVPDLILPDRIFPRQNSFKEIPFIDFQLINDNGGDSIEKIRNSLSEIGCFQLINHGISDELIRTVARRAGRIFRMSPEKKKMAARSPSMEFGFEVVGGGEEEVVSEIGEEFVWGRSGDFDLKMEGIWTRFSKFSDKMERLASKIEKLAHDIMLILKDEKSPNIIPFGDGRHDDHNVCVCHIYKHPHGVPADQCISSLRYDVIRMMIKGSDYSHALSLSICDGSSEFHVYSKKGWISFTPLETALIVTAGDKLQAWSGGRYKHVIGKPIYTSKREDCISLAFLYSPSTTKNIESTVGQYQEKKDKIISLRQQALFAILFTIACQFLFHIYSRISHP